MVDRSKDFAYQQQLAAWGFRGHYPSTAQAPSTSAAAAHPGFAHQNYMQQLQTFNNTLAASFSHQQQQQAQQQQPQQQPQDVRPNYNYKDPLHGFLDYHRPLPAHSPLPAHMRSPAPLPAHMRSYQPPYNSPLATNSPYHPNYHLQSTTPVTNYYPPPPPANSAPTKSPYNALDFKSKQPQPLTNGGQYGSSYHAPKDYSASSSAKDNNGIAKPPASSYYSPSASSSSGYSSNNNGSTAPSPYGGAGNYDEIAAQILNRYGNQFGSQFLLEMTKQQQQLQQQQVQQQQQLQLQHQQQQQQPQVSQQVQQQPQPLLPLQKSPAVPKAGYESGLDKTGNASSSLPPAVATTTSSTGNTNGIPPSNGPLILNTPSVPDPFRPFPSTGPTPKPSANNDVSSEGSWKRKTSFEGEATEEKRPRTDDPYAFDEDDKAIEFGGRFGRKPESPGTQAYKFKNAMLSREQRISRERVKGMLYLDSTDEAFVETCDRFLDDLQGKQVVFSKKPSFESYRAQLAAKAEKKNKKVKEEKKEEPENKTKSDFEENVKEEKVSEYKPDSKPKKGTLWALPIVPKLPQKPAEKPVEKPAPPPSKDSSQPRALEDVWRQAFGAGKTAKKEVPSAPVVKQEVELEIPKKKSTVLDIPPEIRRRPRPTFGGLIHFSPDWEKSVKTHHKDCRLPEKLVKGIKVKPKILSSNTPLKTSSVILAPNISPQDKYPSTTDPVNPDLSPPKLSAEVEPKFRSLLDEDAPAYLSSVQSVLENRKKLRMTMGRMFRVPFMKEIKKKQKVHAFDQLPTDDDGVGLLPTPGLPLLTEDTTEVLMGTSNFGNFRRQTLLRYLDTMSISPELKAKVLDWKPEVFETKTRRQSNQIKEVTSYREIFGIDLPDKKGRKKKEKGKKSKPKVEVEEMAETVVKKETEESPLPSAQEVEKTTPETPPVKEKRKYTPRKNKRVVEVESEDEYVPNEDEQELQTELQNFALHLLDTNPSWNSKTVIQNLVIWEPVGDPVLLMAEMKKASAAKKRPKKHKKRQSGLDFSTKKKRVSRDVSRATTPEPADVKDVVYTLDNTIAEAKGWVLDRGAGETILHRAAKMGYPDVVAYALSIAKLDAGVKDNAGIPPIHKAAFRGHGDIVEYLLRFGVDPNTNVKGTRPLHEALEGGSTKAVHHLLEYGSDPLLYDYSGNMPIDLTEDDDAMKRYFTAVLADLHGKVGERWNVSHCKQFVTPPDDLDAAAKAEAAARPDIRDKDFEFEVSASHPMPTYYQMAGRDGHFVLLSDVRKSTSERVCEQVSAKCEVTEMSVEEFVRSSHVCSLGLGATTLKPSMTTVKMARVDAALKKCLGIEGHLFSNIEKS